MTLILDAQSSGISGNMIVGALIDLGADKDKVKNIMESSAREFGKINVKFTKVSKNGIESTYCNVETIEKGEILEFKDFIKKIEKLNIDEKVKETSINVFKRIAIAESKVHGMPFDKVHFHEVGSSDAVADVIGSIFAFYSLGLDNETIIGLPIAVGGGRIETQHGMIPIPAPAVVEILKEAKCVGGPIKSELATPTGCAIYMELVDEIKEFLPAMTPERIGYGAGSKDFNHPNIFRIIKSKENIPTDHVEVLETNIDHLTGEEIGYLFDKLLSEGASDVSVIPIIMKKNRQGTLIKIIAKKSKRDHLINVLFNETGTLGIRIIPQLHRGLAERKIIEKEIEINNEKFIVRYKVGKINDKIISKRPEYEDVKKIANETNLPLREIIKIVGE